MGRYSEQSTGGNFKQIEPGTYIARCYKIIDIGTQKNEFEGKITYRNQVIVAWEIPSEEIEVDGIKKPYTISKFYTNSMHEKSNLRIDLESWGFKIQEPFDLEEMIGEPCMLSIIDKKGRSVVASVAKLPKGMECPKQFNEDFVFWLDPPLNQELFDSMSDKMQAMIKRSPEYQELVKDPIADLKDDIPF